MMKSFPKKNLLARWGRPVGCGGRKWRGKRWAQGGGHLLELKVLHHGEARGEALGRATAQPWGGRGLSGLCFFPLKRVIFVEQCKRSSGGRGRLSCEVPVKPPPNRTTVTPARRGGPARPWQRPGLDPVGGEGGDGEVPHLEAELHGDGRRPLRTRHVRSIVQQQLAPRPLGRGAGSGTLSGSRKILRSWLERTLQPLQEPASRVGSDKKGRWGGIAAGRGWGSLHVFHALIRYHVVHSANRLPQACPCAPPDF